MNLISSSVGSIKARSTRLSALGGVVTALPLVLGTVVVRALGGPALERVATSFFITLTVVVALQVFTGNSGVLSFGHYSFVALAAYVSGLLTIPAAMKDIVLRNPPAWLEGAETSVVAAAAVSLVLTAIVALAVGIPLARLHGASAVIATLAFLIVVQFSLLGAVDVTNGSSPLFGIPQYTTLALAAGVAILAVITARLFKDSVGGLRLRASREDELAARVSGVSVAMLRVRAWILSALIAASAGILFAHYLSAFGPQQFYFTPTFGAVAILILGGSASVTGGVVGSLLVTLVFELLRRAEAGLHIGGLVLPELFGLTQVFVGLVLIVMMWRRPQGLVGRWELDELFPFRVVHQTGVRIRNRTVPDAPVKEATEAVLETEDLHRSFEGLEALSDVTLQVRAGEIVGLIGPNGSGKTTLINVVSGVMPPSHGRVRLDGTDISGWPPNHIAAAGLARTFQTVRLFKGLTVAENIEVGVAVALPGQTRMDLRARADEIMDLFSLSAESARIASTLPYGSQRRVEIARALGANPRFLLLDEPAAGMNESESDNLMNTLREIRRDYGVGILLVEHDLRVVMRLCDRVYVLTEGQLIAHGNPRDIQTNDRVVQAYLGRRSVRSTD